VSVVLPEPVALDQPPGRPAALEDLVGDVAGAALQLRHLDELLGRPELAVGAWSGADADAARGQVAVVRGLVGGAAAALETAAARLSAHHDLLLAARATVARLRAEQEDDVAAVQGVLAGRALAMPVTALGDDPRAVAAVEAFAAAERRRRLEHERLLAEVADDAAVTAGTLAGCSAVYGPGGQPRDDGATVVHLATVLPGWGDAELTRRGRALAESLVGEAHTPEETLELAARAAVYASTPAFAAALLGELGADGVELLLVSLGMNRFGPPGPLAQVLAAAFSAVGAVPDRREVAAVVTAGYVDPDDAGGRAGPVAAGMAAVLAAGARGRQLPPATVAEWARQLLVREQRAQVPIGIGSTPPGWPAGTGDPAAFALGVLADSGDPQAAAALLATAETWEVLLWRDWLGSGAAPEIVALAGRAEDGAARHALDTGLEVLGRGLADGDPDGWTANRGTAAALAAPLGEGLATHVDVVADPLTAAATEPVGDRVGNQLRGLGLVTVDRTAAGEVERALARWATDRHEALADPAAASVPAAGAVGSLVAVQEYGQRLDHALEGFALQAQARRAKQAWDVVTFPLELAPGAVGDGLGVGAGYLAIAVDADGTWDEQVDDGLVFDRAAAASAAQATVPASRSAAEEVAGAAAAAFDRVIGLLGRPEAPESPPEDYLGPIADQLVPDGKGRRSPKPDDPARSD
jgi:hypothetical protein